MSNKNRSIGADDRKWPNGLMDENKKLQQELEALKLKSEVDDKTKQKMAARIAELELMLMHDVEH